MALCARKGRSPGGCSDAGRCGAHASQLRSMRLTATEHPSALLSSCLTLRVAPQEAAAKKEAEKKEEAPKEEVKAEAKPAVAISAAVVKQLREKSGAGMMDCKKALAECNGDVEAASEVGGDARVACAAAAVLTASGRPSRLPGLADGLVWRMRTAARRQLGPCGQGLCILCAARVQAESC